jgi:predicted  nucleic acid-binding Zn-ribbon protein
MTIEDCLDAEETALWRDTERQLSRLSNLMIQWRQESAAADARFKESIAALADQSRETNQRLHELGEATDARIAALVSAIRQGRHPPQ